MLLDGLVGEPQGAPGTPAPRPRRSPVTILIGQFKGLIIWILVAAGVLAGLLGEGMDAIAILAIVVLNAAIGFSQELGAARSIAALERLTAPRAKVLRERRVTEIAASGVVAGDILVLEAGEVVAADARLLTAASLRCTESALTSESDAVTKRADAELTSDVSLGDRENMVFMGTNVAGGTGQAVVVATAMATELGRIAGLIEEADADKGTPLQRKLDSFGTSPHQLMAATLDAVVAGIGRVQPTPAPTGSGRARVGPW